MKDYGTEVKLIGWTPDSVELLEYASRLCVDKDEETGKREGYIRDRIAQGHESIVEHASASFLIVCSRVVTHELVRHRIASYSQRSQRYVNEKKPQYITPPSLRGATGQGMRVLVAGAAFERCMKISWEVYETLLECDIPPEIARYVLPNACQTKIVATMNFRELRHFIKLRTSPKALPEMREVAGKIRDICKELAPEVFEDV